MNRREWMLALAALAAPTSLALGETVAPVARGRRRTLILGGTARHWTTDMP
jgi:hypothetical protein